MCEKKMWQWQEHDYNYKFSIAHPGNCFRPENFNSSQKSQKMLIVNESEQSLGLDVNVVDRIWKAGFTCDLTAWSVTYTFKLTFYEFIFILFLYKKILKPACYLV